MHNAGDEEDVVLRTIGRARLLCLVMLLMIVTTFFVTGEPALLPGAFGIALFDIITVAILRIHSRPA